LPITLQGLRDSKQQLGVYPPGRLGFHLSTQFSLASKSILEEAGCKKGVGPDQLERLVQS